MVYTTLYPMVRQWRIQALPVPEKSTSWSLAEQTMDEAPLK